MLIFSPNHSISKILGLIWKGFPNYQKSQDKMIVSYPQLLPNKCKKSHKIPGNKKDDKCDLYISLSTRPQTNEDYLSFKINILTKFHIVYFNWIILSLSKLFFLTDLLKCCQIGPSEKNAFQFQQVAFHILIIFLFVCCFLTPLNTN